MSFWSDLDGTITKKRGFGISEMKLPWWVVWFFIKIYKPPAREEVVALMRYLKDNGEEVGILTSRPKEIEKLTIRYLNKKNIPFDRIIFVGTGPGVADRKAKKLKEVEARYFFDNNEKVIKRVREEGIAAFLIKRKPHL